MAIPFNRPALVGRELDYIREAIANGQLAGDGVFTERCEKLLGDFLGSSSVFLTHSGTAALEMAAILIDIQPGDEVIMPSYTFVSTANAVVLRGGVPVFVDIRPDTLNLDESLVEGAITARTRAVFPIHYGGVPADMDTLSEIAARHQLHIVEDAAQALGSEYKGRKAGSFGQLAAFSFHETKNVISGEGGALAINDPSLIERAEVIREKGTNRKLFFRGQVDKYTWVDVGSSFLPGELIAAFLYGQLEKMETITKTRLETWKIYDDALRPFNKRGLVTPIIPSSCTHNGHLYYVLLPNAQLQQELIERMRNDGIVTPFHYVPLHSSPAGKRLSRTHGDLPHTEDLSRRLARLPLFSDIEDDVHKVVERLTAHLSDLL